MACNLREDPAADFDFLATKNTETTLFIDSQTSAARIEDAHLNDIEVIPDANHKIKVSFKAGANSLKLTVNGANAGDEVRLNEVCDSTTTKIQNKFTFTGDPVVIYEISAS